MRIAGGLTAGSLRFRRELQSVSYETTVRYAKSLEEAEALLDNWE